MSNNLPKHDPYPPRRRDRAEVGHLREAICAAAQAGRSACDGNPELAAVVAPLLARLDDIREEIDRLDAPSAVPMAGELYPFWARLARGEAL